MSTTRVTRGEFITFAPGKHGVRYVGPLPSPLSVGCPVCPSSSWRRCVEATGSHGIVSMETPHPERVALARGSESQPAPLEEAALRDYEVGLPAVSDEEAEAILSRFIASHFRKTDHEHARFRIPADPAHDDDLRMSRYIRETRALRAALASRPSPPRAEEEAVDLRPWVRHTERCLIWSNINPTCDCGLLAALGARGKGSR